MISLVTFVWSILNTVLRGFLVKTFWVWFVLSQFPSLPHINIYAAIGFSLVVGALAPLRSPSATDIVNFGDQDKEERKLVGLFTQLGFTLGFFLSWGMGWVVHHFI